MEEHTRTSLGVSLMDLYLSTIGLLVQGSQMSCRVGLGAGDMDSDMNCSRRLFSLPGLVFRGRACRLDAG